MCKCRVALLFMIAALLVLAGHADAQTGSSPASQRPNILLIIADDWSWPHAEPYGSSVIKTPSFNRLASTGVLFHNAFTAAPTCTASRGALLTGQHPHRLEQGANLWSLLPARFATYPDILATQGYRVGQSGKGWSPGTTEATGRSHNPAGPTFASFDAFLKQLPADAPFCFWHGSQDPHRPYEKGLGVKSGLDPKLVTVPPFLPDTPEVRSDILDYLYEVRRFDETVGKLVKALEASGRAENTIVVITSDNGMPFPRSKANLYDSGTHVPLLICWPKGITQPREVSELVSLVDVAPTLLEAVGLPAEPRMTGQSLLGLLREGRDPTNPRTGRPKYDRSFVVVERERHANVRADNLGYPARGLRTRSHLLIRNFEPTRHPAGDPTPVAKALGVYGDIDGGPSKDLIVERARSTEPEPDRFARRAVALRPGVEFFDLANDPDQLQNLAEAQVRSLELNQHEQLLMSELARLGDLRAHGSTDFWDNAPYVNARGVPVGGNPNAKVGDNELTPLEKTVGWTLLFDGQSLNGWTTDQKQPSKTPVQDSAINPHKAGGYMLIHEEPVDNFVLTLDFKISPKCNTGVFFRTWPLEPRPGKDVGFNGLEIAIDDTSTAGLHDTGALYDLVAPARNAMKPVGEWNHLMLVADGPEILVEINGQTVTRTRLSDWTEPNKRPDGSPHKFDVAFKNHPAKGYIGLQDHGGDCWYKNIKMLKLK